MSEVRAEAGAFGEDHEVGGANSAPPNQPLEPGLTGEGSAPDGLAPPLTESELRAALAEITAQKEDAVRAHDFYAAARARDVERGLQRELAARFPAGVYRIRLDRPDGSHVVAESPDLAEAMALAGFHDITDELRALLYAARVLDKAYSGAGRAFR